MKKSTLFLGLLVVLLVIGLVFGGCDFFTNDDGEDSNSGSGSGSGGGSGGGSGSGSGGGSSTLKAPTGLTAEGISSSRIKISWNAVTDASSYRIYRSDNASGPYADIGSIYSQTSCTDSNLSPATTFYYKVAARNSSTDGEQSISISATTWLVAPSGVNAISETSSSIAISWDNLSGATAYRIYRGTEGYSFSIFTEIGTSPSNSYTDTGLPSNVRYYYKVSGYNSITEGDQSYNDGATTLLKAPTGVTAEGISSSRIKISWNAVTDASSYRVYRSDNASGPYVELGTVYSGTSTTNSGLSSATTFYYKVAARNSSTGGEQSDAVSATTNWL